jgi:primase-polymerase (primpol)-like protein
MPPELKELPNWLLWYPFWTGSKWSKRPIQPSGYGASSTNPRHWHSFAEIKRAYESAVERGYMRVREQDQTPQRVRIGGVGFVFDEQPDENGLVLAGTDFDDAITCDGVVPYAMRRRKRLKSHTERSVSGSGYHVISKARPLQHGVNHNHIEMYTSGRFFTMTGWVVGDAQIINAATDEFAALAEELLAAAAAAKSKDRNSSGKTKQSPPDQEKTEVLESTGWFAKLPNDKQCEVLKYAALHIAGQSRFFELTKNGGN